MLILVFLCDGGLVFFSVVIREAVRGGEGGGRARKGVEGRVRGGGCRKVRGLCMYPEYRVWASILLSRLLYPSEIAESVVRAGVANCL